MGKSEEAEQLYRRSIDVACTFTPRASLGPTALAHVNTIQLERCFLKAARRERARSRTAMSSPTESGPYVPSQCSEHNEGVEKRVIEIKSDLAVLLDHMGKHGESLPLHEVPHKIMCLLAGSTGLTLCMAGQPQEIFQKSWNVTRADHPFFHSGLHSANFWRHEHYNETQALIEKDKQKRKRLRAEELGERDGSYIKLKQQEEVASVNIVVNGRDIS